MAHSEGSDPNGTFRASADVRNFESNAYDQKASSKQKLAMNKSLKVCDQP